VYFTAGLTNQAHGLLGALAFGNNGGTPAFGAATASSNLSVTAGSSVSTGIAISPTNNFSGTITLACTTPIVGVTCSFSPTSLTVGSGAVATGTVTLKTTARSASLNINSPGHGISYAFLFPLAGVGLVAMRRRISTRMRLVAASVILLGLATALTGCGDNASAPGSPAGTGIVAVTATSGTVAQTMKINLTVN
jgi:hypothetical protein